VATLLPRGFLRTAASRNRARAALVRLDNLHDGANGLTAVSLTLPAGGTISVGGTNVLQSDGALMLDRTIYQMGSENLSGGATAPEATTTSTSYVTFWWGDVWIDDADKTASFKFQGKQNSSQRSYCTLDVNGSTDEKSTGAGSGYESLTCTVDVTSLSSGFYTMKLKIKTSDAGFTSGVKSGQLRAKTY
jgi:hypothetical protein